MNWNSGKYLTECLGSIWTFGGDETERVIVVDNGSVDGSLSLDDDQHPLQIYRAGQNLGFAKACNLGASQCTAPYILFLNPDARLMKDTLACAVAFMDSKGASSVGICGVRLVDERGLTHRHCARFPKVRTFVGRALGLEGLHPVFFPSHFMREFDHMTSRVVDQVIGAFFLVRRNVFESLGGFDERFFVYFEEVDFALRAKQAGWSTWYSADAVAFHKGGGTSEQVKAERLYYSVRSRLLFFLKHFSLGGATCVIVLTLFIEPFARLVRAALRASPLEMWDSLRGYGMIWRSLPEFLPKRKSSSLQSNTDD